MKQEPLVLSESLGTGLQLLSFNVPSNKNAMTEAMGVVFRELYLQLKEDSSLQAVVVTGTGDAFSSGGDLGMLSRLAEMSTEDSRSFIHYFYDLYLGIFSVIDVPIIAAVNGAAVGAGFSFACACDIRIVAKGALLGATFSKIGLYPGMGASCTLPNLIGGAKALEHLCLGSMMPSEKWDALGLCNEVVPKEETLERAVKIAREIAKNSNQAVRQIIHDLRRMRQKELEIALAREAQNQSLCFATDEYKQRLERLKRQVGY